LTDADYYDEIEHDLAWHFKKIRTP
jgi:hypothetical protein